VAQACLDSALVLEAPEIVIGTAPFTYTWTRPDGTTEESETLLVPSVQDVEEYCVTVSDACNLSTEACLDVLPYTPIPATFQVDENLGCTPFVATMTSDYTIFQNLQSMTWSSDNGQTQNILGSSSFIYPIAGAYRPILEIVDINGCVYSDTLDNAINVLQSPVADFIMDPEDPYLPQTTIRFRDNSSNAATFLYNFSNLGNSEEPNTEFTFPDERGVYFVELVVQNEIGCPDTIRKDLIIREELNIFIPNSFTPDGDGVNDIWRIQGTGFVNQNYELTILNRWGQPVFQSTDPNEPWLGDMQSNGYYSQDSLYFYILKIQDIENDVRYEYKGHITLLR
jgi:gliding motility-associated-like protein